MKKLIIISFLLLTCKSAIYSQSDTSTTYTLKGTIVNGNTNELLMGANIIINHQRGTKTDENGNFSVKIKKNDSIKISFIGFKTLYYISPFQPKGEYLTKFKLYRDSVSLQQIEIFPWPNYKEFKKAFLTMDKQNEQIKMEGVKMYKDRVIHETYDLSPLHIFTNPASFIYDKLFDKKAKLKRKLKRRREIIKKESMDSN
jgi:hypothetical protein